MTDFHVCQEDKILPWRKLESRAWRIRNLYWIYSKNAQAVIPFKPNPAQEAFMNSMHTRNLILKSRQLGFTTLIDVGFCLDTALWYPGTKVLIVADTENHAKEFMDEKIKDPYSRLPSVIRDKCIMKGGVWSKGAVTFKHKGGPDSKIYAGSSARSGSFNVVHVSEYGYTAVFNPDKAKKIKTGVIPAMASTGLLFIESTAHSDNDMFVQMCRNAIRQANAHTPFDPLDMKLFFRGWTDDASEADPNSVVFHVADHEYFAKIEKHLGITIPVGKKAWYKKMKDQLGEDVRQEFPATPQEAFESRVEGCIFKNELQDMVMNKRITNVPFLDCLPVETWWDLGFNDMMTIIFTQTVGREIHIINYYENRQQGFPFYKKILEKMTEDFGYKYGEHNAPHDIVVHELGTGESRIEMAAKCGIKFRQIKRIGRKIDAIHRARSMFGFMFIDKHRCEQAVAHLTAYRFEYDSIRGVFRDVPVKDVASHCADAFFTLCSGHEFAEKTFGVLSNKSPARKVLINQTYHWA